MSYVKYGITSDFVERVKLKLKNPVTKDKVKVIVKGLNKYDLQDRVKVKRLLGAVSKALNEKVSGQLEENIVTFIIAQKIDPNNTLHLLKLWGMFR